MTGQQVLTVTAIEKVQLSRIGSRSRAFQRAIDEVRTLPLSPEKVAQKRTKLRRAVIWRMFFKVCRLHCLQYRSSV